METNTSHGSSPPPMSDDSAIGSLASAATQNTNGFSTTNSTSCSRSGLQSNSQQSLNLTQPTASKAQHRSQAQNHQETSHTPPNDEGRLIRPDELRIAASRMRYNNTTLTSRSIRTNLSCFNDLDIQRFDSSPEYLVNFVSIGINKSQNYIHRPVSLLWPETYDKMIEELAKLDAYLINTEYKEKPLDWMIARSLTIVPDCRICKEKMILRYDSDSVRWHCVKTPACRNLFAPVLRPSTFSGYENVALMKLLFSIYYWATCTQCDLLYGQLRLEPDILHGIWRNIQNICRVALEKSYPRFRLCNSPQSNNEPTSSMANNLEPVDLISIKFNGNFIVCAKHPQSNCVRLGLYIPKMSQYTFAELTESWFAHGAHIRICEAKFGDLRRLRSDLKIDVVPRFQMITKDKKFNRQSAFGYLVCQLTHIFKDFDSSAVTRESLKLILAELEWRELYGTNPYDAFTKIVEHMALYRSSVDCYFEAPINNPALQEVNALDDSDYVYAEKYFYATLHPVDRDGRVIQRYGQRCTEDDEAAPIVQFRCHLCKTRFESFYFSMHMVAHVERNRRDDEEAEYAKTKKIRCKHCFRLFSRRAVALHGNLLRADYQSSSFGCRICCSKFGTRAKFLDHMRRTHYSHEMPYRCPSCKFASSFQRELFIHFQEEHQLDFIILCPFCARGFTVADPSNMTESTLDKISQQVYRHISQHYLVSSCHSCENCCLTFLDRKSLLKHRSSHHNPLEIFNSDVVSIQPFIVTRSEEHFCTQASAMELFIPNKQPNIPLKEGMHHAVAGSSIEPRINNNSRSPDSDSSSSDAENDENSDRLKRRKPNGVSKQPHKHASGAELFLAGGEASLRINARKNPEELTTERILELLCKFKRADCIIPNQSVLLNPESGPVKCLECSEHFTADHLVSTIQCRPCKFLTHCPRALTKHKMRFHSDD